MSPARLRLGRFSPEPAEHLQAVVGKVLVDGPHRIHALENNEAIGRWVGRRSVSSYFSREEIGQRLSGLIYGTVIVISVVVAAARAYPHDAGHIAAVVGVTSVVFWLAHVYAHGIAESVADDQRFSLTRLRRLARREASIVEAAIAPFVALLLAAFGLLSTQVAIWLAIGLGLAVLLLQGIIFARMERLGPLATLGVVTANLFLGVVLVGLKLLVSY